MNNVVAVDSCGGFFMVQTQCCEQRWFLSLLNNIEDKQ
jgi:hypothetical protein